MRLNPPVDELRTRREPQGAGGRRYPMRTPRSARASTSVLAGGALLLLLSLGCTRSATTDVSAGPNGTTAGSVVVTSSPGTAVVSTTTSTTSTTSTTPAPGSSLPTNGPGTTRVPAVDLAKALEGRTFESQSVVSKGVELRLVPGTKLTLSFREGNLGASAGCNSIGGAYRIEGDVLLVGGLGTTDMACQPDRMKQDEWLSGALGASPHLRLDGSRLVLDAPETTIVFTDRKVSDPDRPLAGPHWLADTVVAGDAASSIPVGATAPSLDFAADGTFTGFSGCAPLTGRYTVEGARLVLDDVVVANAAACTVTAESLDQATRAVLQGTITFEIDGPGLRLANGANGLHLRAT